MAGLEDLTEQDGALSLRKRLSERTEAAGVSDISTVHTLDRQTDALDYIPLIVGRVVRREKCNFDSNLFMFFKMLVFTTSLSLQLHSSCFQTPVALGSQGCRVSSFHSPSWCQSSHRVRLASPVRINSASFILMNVTRPWLHCCCSTTNGH